MGGACGMYGKKRNVCRAVVDRHGYKRSLKILELDGVIILKGNFEDERGGRELHSCSSRQRQLVCCCEQGMNIQIP